MEPKGGEGMTLSQSPAIQTRLLDFFEGHGHFLNGQYGFRCKHSTDMAIIDMVERIRKAWDAGDHCMGIFVDLRKAFDTVDHCILVSKLEHAGVRGIPLELLKSYFQNRRQYVVFQGAESSLLEMTCGVPQGSILGPLFFLLYVNDLARSSDFFRFILFADDTNLFASAKTKGALYRKVREELGLVSDWFACNKLTLNYKKTEYIDFSKPDGSSTDNFFLKIDGQRLRKVDQSKFLGVLIDQDLSWRGHIRKIITKMRQTMGLIGRAKGFMDEAQVLLLYNTMVLPHLQYCLINWGNFAGDRNLGLMTEILTLQKSFVRIITASPPRSHADPLFARLRILKIGDLFGQRLRMFSYKSYHNKLPGEMGALLDKVGDSHSHDTRGARCNLFVSRDNVKSIKYIAPKHWNALEEELRKSGAISTFKNKSKEGFLLGYSKFKCNVKGCYSCNLP